jgi:hypothetical protein
MRAAKKVSKESVKGGRFSDLERLRRSKSDLFGGTLEVQPGLVVAFVAVCWYVLGRPRTQNGNSGSLEIR